MRTRERISTGVLDTTTNILDSEAWLARENVCPVPGFTANVIPCPGRSTSKTDGLETRLGDPR
jgi:hypothetical protein